MSNPAIKTRCPNCHELVSQGDLCDCVETSTERWITVPAPADWEIPDIGNEPEQVTRIRAELHELAKVYARKRADYGDSFTRSMDRWGVASARPRLSDKVERFYTLCEQDAAVKGETIIDTLLDLALYAVMVADWLKVRE